jgi:hypothetical protein
VNQIQLASQFYDAHEALRRLLGKEKFDSSMKPYCRALKQRMRDKNLNEVEAALHLLKEISANVPDIQDRTVATMYTLAAAVEVCEASVSKTPKTEEAAMNSKAGGMSGTSPDSCFPTPRADCRVEEGGPQTGTLPNTSHDARAE